eukprot:SAG31_NODE_373_length_16597_cov_21.519518_14_plen_69_part_00
MLCRFHWSTIAFRPTYSLHSSQLVPQFGQLLEKFFVGMLMLVSLGYSIDFSYQSVQSYINVAQHRTSL